eukprot:684541-Lingulodinium_polyedra.AAC.1
MEEVGDQLMRGDDVRKVDKAPLDVELQVPGVTQSPTCEQQSDLLASYHTHVREAGGGLPGRQLGVAVVGGDEEAPDEQREG